MTAAPSLGALLWPRLLAARNVARRHPWRPLAAGGMIAAFWGAAFWASARALGYFQTLGDFGPLLTQRFLALLFLSASAVLLISNTVTALTTFYLADDVTTLLAAPVPARRLHQARFVETLLSSSWMVVVATLPVLAALGVTYQAGGRYYAGAAAVLACLLVILTAVGVLLTTALVLVAPARRARDAMLIGAGLLLGGVVLAVRLLDPERLAQPSGLAGFAGFLATLGATGSPWLPSTWAAEVLIPLLGARAGEPLFHLALLASTAAALSLVSATVGEWVFLRAWSRAQTGRVWATGAERPLGGWLAVAVRPLPRVAGLLLAKDVAVFLRDPSQWSQLLLVGALVAIYVYNFAALPLDDTPLALAMRDLAAVMNLGLGAFVTTAVAVRFVYPMASLEGRSWWILRTAPVALGRLWWSKFWIGYLPLVCFAAGLVVATNRMLGVAPAVTAAFLVTLLPLVAAVVSLGLAFGAAHARLDTQNAAQIATSFGAVAYMLTCLGLIAAVVAIEAWPVAHALRAARGGGGGGETIGWHAPLAAGMLAGTGISALVFALARRRGLRALGRLGG